MQSETSAKLTLDPKGQSDKLQLICQYTTFINHKSTRYKEVKLETSRPSITATSQININSNFEHSIDKIEVMPRTYSSGDNLTGTLQYSIIEDYYAHDLHFRLDITDNDLFKEAIVSKASLSISCQQDIEYVWHCLPGLSPLYTPLEVHSKPSGELECLPSDKPQPYPYNIPSHCGDTQSWAQERYYQEHF